MNKEKNVKAYLAWIFICIIWGTTYLAIRIGVKDVSPALFTGLRWIAAGPVLFAILILRGYKLPPKKELLQLLIMAVALIGIGNGLLVFAEKYIPSGIAALVVTTIPFWMVGFDSFLPQGKKINLMILSGLVLGLFGVFLIFSGNLNVMLNHNYLIGIASLLLSMAGWTFGTLYSKHKKLSVNPLMGASVQMIIAGTIVTLIALLLGEFSSIKITHNGFLAFLYLVIVGSILSYPAYIYAVVHLPVSLVSTYAYINPLIALFLGWLVLSEEISTSILIAAVVILAGVTLVKKGSA